VAGILNEIADLYRQTGRDAEAESLEARSARIRNTK